MGSGSAQSQDAAAPDSQRNETPTERLDRNWEDILQELRVSQTGVQLLTGFLITLPFQDAFGDLEDFQVAVYLVTIACAIGATGFLVAPVALHRLLFRRHLRRQMVHVAHYFALTGLGLLACSVVGVVLLTFSVVTGDAGGVVAAAVAAVLLVVLWLLVPLWLRQHPRDA